MFAFVIASVALSRSISNLDTASSKNYGSRNASRLPSMIFILTDDQDIHLGGMEPLPKTRKLLGQEGASATNWFIHTPVCCPSRAETLTGKYFHNIKVDQVHVDLSVINTTKSSGGCGDHNGCMCVDDDKVNNFTFAVDLARVGYRVGMFGKYLNSWSGKIQPGFSRWFANGGGAYFNTSFNDDRSPTGKFHANKSFYSGYQTSILGNVSINWIKEIVTNNGTAGKGYVHAPFFAYVGVHAPHLPSTPAPWYTNNTFTESNLSRYYMTPNYNSSAKDHHWCVAQQPPITSVQAQGIDALFRDRWRTLMSVDDLVEAMVQAVTDLGIQDHTYFFFSSDHGYNLGQMRLTGNKLHAYEHTLRIPMYIRGPGIAPGTLLDIPGSNTDLAPTWLALAGVTQARMDGSSFLPHLLSESDPNLGNELSESDPNLGNERHDTQALRPWRDFHYAEYNSLGNLWRGGGEIMSGDHLIDDPVSHTYRALRFVNSSARGNILYAEYTSLIDWDFRNYSTLAGQLDPYSYKFYELFDLDADPWQLTNIYANATEGVKRELHALIASEFGCSGSACK